MRLATLNEGGRDGTLIVVSRDLQRAIKAMDIARTLQQALDDWSHAGPKLELLYKQLSAGTPLDGAFAFDPAKASAPLPRAYQLLTTSPYPSYAERVGEAVDAGQLRQASSDYFLPPQADVPYVHVEDWGVDFEAGVAVVTGAVPMGVSAEAAAESIHLVMLYNGIVLRQRDGVGRPPASFSPVAVSPKSLGHYWQNGVLHRPLRSAVNGTQLGEPDAAKDFAVDFSQLIARAARLRPLAAGTIIAAAPVSNQNAAAGYAAILEKRAVEKACEGEHRTSFLKSGDSLRVEVLDDYHNSIFGAISQTAIPYPHSK